MKEKWQAYDPDWIVELAKEQIPDRPEIIRALSECIKARVRNRAYTYFVSADNANQPNSEWQFKGNVMLEDKKHGIIILDVLRGDRIGGIEFYECKE